MKIARWVRLLAHSPPISTLTLRISLNRWLEMNTALPGSA